MDTTIPFELTQLDDSPVILCTFSPEFRLRQHLAALVERMTGVMLAAPGPAYTILDIRHIRLDWSDLVLALADIR